MGARSQTTGVVTVDFTLKEKGRELKLELVDVGGQRGERRRWIHCFEGVTAVMFIISLSDYNQVLWEDETTNRMLEAYKEYTVPKDANNDEAKEKHALQFIKDQFTAQDKQDKKKTKNKERIYTFQTTATDTSLVNNVFVAVTAIIIEQVLHDTGLQ